MWYEQVGVHTITNHIHDKHNVLYLRWCWFECRGRGLSGVNRGEGGGGFRERGRVADEGSFYSVDLGRDCKCLLHSNLEETGVGGEENSNSSQVTTHTTLNLSQRAPISAKHTAPWHTYIYILLSTAVYSLSRREVACLRRCCLRQLCLALYAVWFPFSGNPCHEEGEWGSRLHVSRRKMGENEHHKNSKHTRTRSTLTCSDLRAMALFSYSMSRDFIRQADRARAFCSQQNIPPRFWNSCILKSDWSVIKLPWKCRLAADIQMT